LVSDSRGRGHGVGPDVLGDGRRQGVTNPRVVVLSHRLAVTPEGTEVERRLPPDGDRTTQVMALEIVRPPGRRRSLVSVRCGDDGASNVDPASKPTRKNRAQGREIAFETTAGPTAGCEQQCDDRRLRLSVLIVDDDPTFVARATRILACLGIEVAGVAADARRALEIVHDVRPTAVLVDVWLPDRIGIDLAYELAELPWAPRVVLTSSDSEAWVAIQGRPGRSRPPFIAKEEFDVEALRRILIE
jgi:CheY-like chemotaxis protein